MGALASIKQLSLLKKLKSYLLFILQPKIIFLSSKIQEMLFGKILKRKFENNFLFYCFLLFFTLGLFLTIYILLFFNSKLIGNNENFLLTICLSIFGICFHELGHSFSCYLVNIGFRPIGFSIYLMFPVFFTNVSGMEHLSLQKKLLIDIGGLSFQGLIMFIYFLLFIIFKNDSLKYALFSLAYIFAFNINPFLSTDGYWCWFDFIKELNNKYKSQTILILEAIFIIGFTFFSLFLLKQRYYMIFSFFSFINNFQLNYLNIIKEFFNLYLIIIVITGMKKRTLQIYKEVQKIIGGLIMKKT